MNKFLGILWLVFAILCIFTGDIGAAIFSALSSTVWFAVAGIEKHFPESQQ